jgi:hypothetical protein
MFKVGDRVRYIPDGSVATVTSIHVSIKDDIVPGEHEVCEYISETSDLELIPPTDEQLIKTLTDAEFTHSEDYEEFFYGDIELEHSKSTTEVVIWGGENGNRRCVIKPCKDLALAVNLALTLKECVK